MLKNSYKINLILLTFTFIFSIINAQTSDAVSKSRVKRVFILHSYNEKNVCDFPQTLGIKERLDQSEFHFKYEHYFMKTKTVNASESNRIKQAEIAISKIKTFKPDILFVLDDNAIQHVASQLLDEDFHIIFSGMNKQPGDYKNAFKQIGDKWYPLKNMTGVYEYLHLARSLNTMHQIFPEMKKIVAIIDMTTTGDAIKKQFDLELEDEEFDFEIEIIRLKTLKELSATIKRLNADKDVGAIYNAAIGLLNEKGEQVSTPITFKYFIEHSKKPGIAINYDFCRLGLFGGVAINFIKMGNETADLALHLLRGDKSISDTPVLFSKSYMIVFNKERARQLNITIPNDIEMIADELYQTIPLLEHK